MIRAFASLMFVLFAVAASASEMPWNLDESEAVSLAKSEICQSALKPFSDVVEDMRVRFQSNLSVRGFDQSHAANTPENAALAKKYGFLWWYTQGFFAKSEAEALEHSRLFSKLTQDYFLVGLYFIADESELGVAASETGESVPEENFNKIIARGAIEITYLDDDGTPLTEPKHRRISGEELAHRINYKNSGVVFVKGNDRSHNSNYINIWGWHTGKFRGIISHEDYLGSTRYARNFNLYRRLYDQGYRAVFNPKDPAIIADAMEVLKNTQRYKRVAEVQPDGSTKTVERPLPLSINRHRLPGVVEKMVAGINAGTTYLSLLLDPDGRVVGGEPGNVKDMNGETILYSESRSRGLPENTTGAQISMALVIKQAVQQDLPYSSSGPMVSQYSALNATVIVPLPQALETLSANSQDVSKMSNNFVWNPYVGQEAAVKKELEEIRKKTENTIGKIGFINSRPEPNEITKPIAEALGLKAQTLYIQVVPTFESAKAASIANPELSAATVYVIPGQTGLPQGLAAVDMLKQMFAKKAMPAATEQRKFVADKTLPENTSVALIVSFRKPSEGRDVRYYDYNNFASRLNLEDYPPAHWEHPSERSGRILIHGWALQ